MPVNTRRILLATAFIVLLATLTGHAQTVAVVLTGGGARGLAQIGVLRSLEKQGIKPDIIVGSSFGAIVGGLYAAGYSVDEIDSIMRNVDWDDVTSITNDTRRESLFFSQKQEWDRSLLTLRFRNFSFMPPTAIGGNVRFTSLLQSLLWNSVYNNETRFDKLRVRFRAVATNLATGKAVALDQGNLAQAIRASATFPLRFSPVRWSADTVLVDGGLVANIPTDVARSMGADVIILVNTTTNLAAVDDLDTPFDIADQALMSAMKLRDKENLALANVVITPDAGKISTFDFGNVAELIALGERAGIAAMPMVTPLINKSRSPIIEGGSISGLTATASTCDLLKKGSFSLPSAGLPDSMELAHALLRMLRECGRVTSYVRNIRYAADSVYVEIDGGVVREVRFEQLDKLRRSDVERELVIRPGSVPTTQDLERTLDNLLASDVLSDPSLDITRVADSGVRVTVHAHDRGNQMMRIGARVDNERYTQGSLELIHANLFSSGVRIALAGTLSERIGSASLSFALPRIAGTFWTASVRGYTSFRNVWVYEDEPGQPSTRPKPQRVDERAEERIGLRASAGRQLERNGELLGEFRYEYQRYRDLNAPTVPEYQPVATVRGVVRWDDRDHIDFATKGRTIDVSIETSLFNLSNGLSFTKLSASASSVFNAGPLTITPSASVGAADRTLPDADQFSLGGQDVFFGWREDQQRGRQIVVGRMDAQYKLPFRFFFDSYVSVRYDIGAIWENPENIRIADMNHGVGFTVGLDTPIGPARFSIGRSFFFQSNPDAVGWGPFLGYFAIGARL